MKVPIDNLISAPALALWSRERLKYIFTNTYIYPTLLPVLTSDVYEPVRAGSSPYKSGQTSLKMYGLGPARTGLLTLLVLTHCK